jgi:hypothetical protein
MGDAGAAGSAAAMGTAGATCGTDASAGAGEGSSGTVDGGSFMNAGGGACSSDGWCWSTPTPQGNPLYAISGSSASDVWAVGDSGSIVHWDGTSWTQVATGEHGALHGVFAAGAHDAWAVGDDAILHWDGAAWSTPPGVPGAGFVWRAVSGTGSGDVWIVGADTSVSGGDGWGGAMLQWDGHAWSTSSVAQDLGAVWGTGSSDAWGLGDAHALFHWDGKTWMTMSKGVLPQIGTAIWGAGSADLWLGSRPGSRPSHWDGTTLALAADWDDKGEIYGLWGSGPNDVWAVGDSSEGELILHWNGLAWIQTPSPGAGQLFGVWGSRADDVWAVGESGALIHWDGRSWSAVSGPPRVGISAIWGTSPDDVWAFGSDGVGLAALRWNGETWTNTELLDASTLGASAQNAGPGAAWGSGPEDIWVGVNDSEPLNGGPSNTLRPFFIHWDGHVWSVDSTLDASTAAALQGFGDIWGNGPSDVWAVGGSAVHWDGKRWSAVATLPSTDLGHPLSSVWSSGPNDVWIGGDAAVHHWNGVSWSQPLSDGHNFIVRGSGPTDVWAVGPRDGTSSTASHWNGACWQDFVVPGVVGPTGVAAISPTNAWVIGDGADAYRDAVAHWDGKAWTPSYTGSKWLGGILWWDGREIWTTASGGLMRHQ